MGFASIAQLASQFLTLIVSLMLARKLDVTGYGIFVFGFAFPSWFLLLVSLGLDEVMATQVAADHSKASEYLTLVGRVRLLLSGFALFGLWVATSAILEDPFARTITMILGVSSIVTTNASTFVSVFRAFERFEYPALVMIIERSAVLATTVVFLLAGFGLFEISFAFLGGSFASLAFSALIVRRRFAWFTKKVSVPSLVRLLKLAMPFGLLNAVGTFTYTMGLVLLTVLDGPRSTGLFNASFALLFALFSFFGLVSVTTLPMMSRIHQESRERLTQVVHRIQKLSIIVGVPLAIGGWFYADAIVTTFYGNSFKAAAESFRILVVSFAIETAVMGMGTALAATGHAKQKFYIAAGSAVVTIAMSFVLIPSYGPVGAAYAFLASRVLMAILGARALQRYLPTLETVGTLVKPICAGFVMTIALVTIPGLSLWEGMLVGAPVYFAMLFGLRGTNKEDRDVIRDALRGALLR